MQKGKILIVIMTLIIAGCVSLKDFEKMSVRERSNYVCQNNSSVNQFKKMTHDYNSAVIDVSEAISRGYRVHRSCNKISVQKEGATTCRSYVTGYDVRTTCDTPTYTSYEKVCQEIPVAIDGNLEQQKLVEYTSKLSKAEKKAEDIFEKCIHRVSKMTPEQAYKYHNK